jgi:hypothetical protein
MQRKDVPVVNASSGRAAGALQEDLQHVLGR